MPYVTITEYTMRILCVDLLFMIISICLVVALFVYSFKHHLLTMLYAFLCMRDLLTASELRHSCKTIELSVVNQSSTIDWLVQGYFTHFTHTCSTVRLFDIEAFEAYCNLLFTHYQANRFRKLFLSSTHILISSRVFGHSLC